MNTTRSITLYWRLLATGLLLASLTLAGCPVPSANLRTVRISAVPRVVDPGATIQFQDVSNLDTGEAAIAWQWSFGDGSTSTEQAPTHAYTVPGTYTVTLTLQTDKDSITPRTETNFIAVRTPEDISPQPGEEYTFANIPFIWIPAGTFKMGSDDPQWGDLYETPVRTITISHGFWMSKTEITQAQWLSVMRENPASFVDSSGQHPVEQVSWNDAQEFISTLNLRETGTFRLPTEAEWEYACRANTTSEWSFGNDTTLASSFAWIWQNARFTTEPVATLHPNAFGLYDMHGNLSEWCQDYFHPLSYQSTQTTDPGGFSWSYYRAVRGGHWQSMVHQCRSAYRDFLFPDTRRNTVGIRLCRN